MNLILFGPPGSGKGTQAKLIADKLGIEHISTGDIFRFNIKNNTPLGRQVKQYLESGGLVPDETTIAMVKERLERLRRDFLLDGFPRSLEQAKALSTFARLDKVIHINLPDEAVVLRITGRRICECGEFYNVNIPALKPKKDNLCDKCGKPLKQRSDDTEETVRERLKVYHEQAEPVLDYYREKSLVSEIDGSLPVSEVTEAIMRVLE